MNKPIRPPVADDDIGALDENGQQLWSAGQHAASARMWTDPAFLVGLEDAGCEADRGEGFTSGEVTALLREDRRRWFAKRRIAPPPGYFDA